jgi:hypothetical protein
MARDGRGWFDHRREHIEAASKGKMRPTHGTRPRNGPKGEPMSKMEENALKFAIRHKRVALEEANLPEFEGEIRTLRNAQEILRFGTLNNLNKHQLEQAESALEMTMEGMADGSSYRDYNGYGSFDSVRKKDLQGALAHVRERR